MAEKKTIKGSVGGSFGKVGKAEASLTYEYSTPSKFMYSCKYCNTKGQVSAPGNSCGKQSCNTAWSNDHNDDSLIRKIGAGLGIVSRGQGLNKWGYPEK